MGGTEGRAPRSLAVTAQQGPSGAGLLGPIPTLAASRSCPSRRPPLRDAGACPRAPQGSRGRAGRPWTAPRPSRRQRYNAQRRAPDRAPGSKRENARRRPRDGRTKSGWETAKRAEVRSREEGAAETSAAASAQGRTAVPLLSGTTSDGRRPRSLHLPSPARLSARWTGLAACPHYLREALLAPAPSRAAAPEPPFLQRPIFGSGARPLRPSPGRSTADSACPRGRPGPPDPRRRGRDSRARIPSRPPVPSPAAEHGPPQGSAWRRIPRKPGDGTERGAGAPGRGRGSIPERAAPSARGRPWLARGALPVRAAVLPEGQGAAAPAPPVRGAPPCAARGPRQDPKVSGGQAALPPVAPSPAGPAAQLGAAGRAPAHSPCRRPPAQAAAAPTPNRLERSPKAQAPRGARREGGRSGGARRPERRPDRVRALQRPQRSPRCRRPASPERVINRSGVPRARDFRS